MNRMKKFVGVSTLMFAATGAGYMGYRFVEGGRYAYAQQEVEATRGQLAEVENLSNIFRQVGKAVEPSVVNIVVKKAGNVRDAVPFEDLRRFLPDRDGDGEPDMPPGFRGEMPDTMATGSGVIMEADGSFGYVLTNNHVAGSASEITITLFDGREITGGKIIGADPKSDLAVVKVEAAGLISAKWGNSDELQKGDFILAFGSPLGYVGSMTHGIVSALNRDVGILRSQQGYENFIQVDAPINPGNSGGPLVNLRGEVVGINTAIASRTGGFQGIGFSIPSNQAKIIYEQLKDDGKVTRGWLGVEIANVAALKDEAAAVGFNGPSGIIVKSTMRNTPASGKLRAGDIITALDGKPMKDVQQLRNLVAATRPGSEITLRVFREGKEEDVKITIGELPDDLSVASNREATEKPDATAAGKLGVKLSDLTPELAGQFELGGLTEGAVITEVAAGSVAERTGLALGEVITRVNDTEVKSAKEAAQLISKIDLEKGARIYLASKDGSRFVFVKSEK